MFVRFLLWWTHWSTRYWSKTKIEHQLLLMLAFSLFIIRRLKNVYNLPVVHVAPHEILLRSTGDTHISHWVNKTMVSRALFSTSAYLIIFINFFMTAKLAPTSVLILAWSTAMHIMCSATSPLGVTTGATTASITSDRTTIHSCHFCCCSCTFLPAEILDRVKTESIFVQIIKQNFICE